MGYYSVRVPLIGKFLKRESAASRAMLFIARYKSKRRQRRHVLDAESAISILLGIRLSIAGASLVAGILAASAGRDVIAIIVVPIVALTNCFAVGAYFKNRRRSWQRQLQLALPAALEILAVIVASGATLNNALAVGADVVPAPVDVVMRRVTLRIACGQSAAESLRHEAKIIDSPLLDRVIEAIEKSQRLGVPLAGRLRGISDNAMHSARSEQSRSVGRGATFAALITSMVIAPACMGILATVMIGGILIGGTPSS